VRSSPPRIKVEIVTCVLVDASVEQPFAPRPDQCNSRLRVVPTSEAMSMSSASSAAGREIPIARFITIANSASEVKEVTQRGA
jgi:hypothetical protein